ncbi:hypothetical protein C4J95_3407 [Pseudomonas orientalis]|nr:hypothetical protein C4J95_3407 [Pseudomonas orientalis]
MPWVCSGRSVLLERNSAFEISFSHSDLSYVCSGNEGHKLP